MRKRKIESIPVYETKINELDKRIVQLDPTYVPEPLYKPIPESTTNNSGCSGIVLVVIFLTIGAIVFITNLITT